MYDTPSHHRRFLIGVSVSLAIGLMLLAAVYALAPADTDAVTTLLAAVLLVVAVLLAGVAVDAHKREQRHLRSQRKARKLGHTVQQLSHRRETSLTRSPAMAGSRMVSVESGEAEPARLPVPAIPPGRAKVCPKCERGFQTTMEHCPFDDSPLQPMTATEVAQDSEDYLDTQRTLMRCPKCEREYDLGTGFCVHDGATLKRVEEEDGGVYFDGEMVCPECGDVFDRDSKFCPNDDARLLPERPGRTHASYVSVPLSICTSCLEEYQAHVTVCVSCGELLLPLLGRKTGAIPTTGLGTKDMLCPECGTRHGNEATYCANDGTELVALN